VHTDPVPAQSDMPEDNLLQSTPDLMNGHLKIVLPVLREGTKKWEGERERINANQKQEQKIDAKIEFSVERTKNKVTIRVIFYVKGIVARDFLYVVFFNNQPHPGH
jgi:hypothetical protein